MVYYDMMYILYGFIICIYIYEDFEYNIFYKKIFLL